MSTLTSRFQISESTARHGSGVLSHLIETTPGEEGKWFATAKTLKRFDLAVRLA